MALTRTQAHKETTRLGHVALYRDELEQIIQAVAEVGEPTIQGSSFRATTADDLAEAAVPERLDSLQIRASRGEQQITVSLRRDRAEVDLVEPDIYLHGAASRIASLCRPHHRWYRNSIGRNSSGTRRVTLSAMAALVAALVANMGFLVGAWPENWGGHPEVQPYTVAATCLCSLALLGIVVWEVHDTRRTSNARLVNAYRAERPTYWQRNRDSLRMAMVTLPLGAVLGAVVGAVVTKLLS